MTDKKTVGSVARYLRSKNAGPFWITIDAFCTSAEDTRAIAAAFERERAHIAEMFSVAADDLLIYCLEDIMVAKVSLPRVPVEGSPDERDMHGGQAYVSLLDIEV